MCQLWWHVYMGEAPGMCEPDETGYRAPALATIIYGDSTTPPHVLRATPDLATTTTIGGAVVPWVVSFDHDPTDAEVAAYRPGRYDE